MNGYIGVSFNIADRLNAGRVKLAFKPNTILEWIGKTVYSPIVDSEGENKPTLIASIESYKADLHAAKLTVSTEDETLVSDEDPIQLTIESVTNDMEKVALGIINKTKNAFIPLVNEIYEKTFEKTRNKIEVGGIKLDVVTDGSESGFWENPVVNAILSQRVDDVDPSYGVGASAEPISDEDLTALRQSVPNDFLPLLSKVTDQPIDVLLKSAYGSLLNSEIIDETIEGVPENLQAIINVFVINFVVHNAPQGVTYQGAIADFRHMVSKCRTFWINRLVELSKIAARNNSTDRLILRFPTEGSAFSEGAKIVVNGLKLQTWIEQGGSLDLIYGSYVADGERDGGELLTNRERYEKAWHRFVATAQQKQSHIFESTFVSILHRAVVQAATDYKIKIDPKGIERMYERTSAVTENNAYQFTRKVVAHCFFKDEDFLTICDHIDQVSANVPGITLEDAIPLAITDWLVAWALSQVSISSES